MMEDKRLDLAKLGLERAEDWLEGAKRAFEDKRWSDVVYSSQMAVEQSMKAVLLALGVDYPREHDVSDVFLETIRRRGVPTWLKQSAKEMADICAELAEQRGLAGYGFELGVDRDHFKGYAPEALQKAERVLASCKKVLSEMKAGRASSPRASFAR